MATDRMKLKFNGRVLKHYISDGKHIINLAVSPKTLEWIMDKIQDAGMMWDGDAYPIKEKDNETYIKMSSGFSIHCDGEVDDVNDVGVGSEIEAYTVWQANKFKRSRYIACYISGMIVNKIEYLEDYSPFNDAEYEDATGVADVPA